MDNLKTLLNQQAVVDKFIRQNAKPQNATKAEMSDDDMKELEAFREEKRQKEEKAAIAKAKREAKLKAEKAEHNDADTDPTEAE